MFTRPRLLLACCLFFLLAASSCGGDDSSSTATDTPTPTPPVTQPLVDPHFSTVYPISWTQVTKPEQAAVQYLLSSGGALNDLGIPPNGSIGISISVVPVGLLHPSTGDASTMTMDDLTNLIAALPKAAVNPKLDKPVTSITLAGDSNTRSVTYLYTYNSIDNVQEDVVNRKGEIVYVIEMDTSPAHRKDGEDALKLITDHWAFQTPTPPPSGTVGLSSSPTS